MSDLNSFLGEAVKAGTFHSLYPLEALQAFAARAHPIQRRRVGESTLEWACRVLGLSPARSVVLQRTVFPDTRQQSTREFVRRIADPRLSTVRHVADVLGADLYHAATFLGLLHTGLAADHA